MCKWANGNVDDVRRRFCISGAWGWWCQQKQQHTRLLDQALASNATVAGNGRERRLLLRTARLIMVEPTISINFFVKSLVVVGIDVGSSQNLCLGEHHFISSKSYAWIIKITSVLLLPFWCRWSLRALLSTLPSFTGLLLEWYNLCISTAYLSWWRITYLS